MTAPSLTPAAIEAVCGRLALMADQGDFGRTPDPADTRRVAEIMIRALAAENKDLAARVEALEAGQEYDILTEFSRAFLDGWLADENPEVRRHWKRVNERLLPRQAAHLLADTSDA